MERLCMLVVSFIVLTSAARDLDFFEAAFGKSFPLYHNFDTQRHDLFAVAREKAIEQISKQSSSDRPGQFMGCSDYRSADIATEALQQEYGQESVRTLFSSKIDSLSVGGGVGLTCFLVQPSSTTPSLLDAKSYLLVWLPVPASMKLSATAHDQLETLLAAEQTAAADSSSPASVMAQLASTELEVHLGNAVAQRRGLSTAAHRHARSKDLASSVQASLRAQTRNTEERGRRLAELSAMIPHAAAWQTVTAVAKAEAESTAVAPQSPSAVSTKGHVRRHLAQQETDTTAEMGAGSGATGGPDCNFDKLVFRAHDEFLFITHMHELANPSCFASVLSTVAQNPDVVSVSAPEGLYQPLMDLVGDLLHSGDPAEGRVYHDVGLTGSGVVVGLLDGGVDEYSCFFNNSDGELCARSTLASPTYDLTRRKVIQYTFDEDSVEKNAAGHGTGMAGIICGKDTSGTYPDHFGVAPGAKIALYDASTSSGANIGPLGDALDTYYDAALTAGAKVYSASFGNRYTEYVARDVVNDQYAVDNDFLLIAAVGNWQSLQYNSTIFSPARSKNALSVGASGASGDSNVDILAYFSVTGPTHDGRFGVDVLAHGVDVFAPKSYGNNGSTAASCEVSSRTGTSSATAAVAGVAALVQEYFENSAFWAASCNQLYPVCSAGAASPKSIMVKAVILHSGQDIGNALYAYPGNEQGFGRVQLNKVLVHPGVTATGLDLFVTEAVLAKNEELEWVVTVTSNTLPLKVTIAWVDPANVVSAAKQLMNDVDLRITDENGAVTYGNNNAAGDAHNNAEMAYIASPAPGHYVVSVSIGTLGSGTSQAVSLVATSYGYVTGGIPSGEPSGQPSGEPSGKPILPPTGEPSGKPSGEPSGKPSLPPTGEPSGKPSCVPTGVPSRPPTGEPSGKPSVMPSGEPTGQPTMVPTHQPNYNRPSARPFFGYLMPTPAPVPVPTPATTATPTTFTSSPVVAPSVQPPTDNHAPTFKPTVSINLTDIP